MYLSKRASFIKPWVAVALGVLITGWPLAALAEFTPPRRGLPGRREGGGTRGPCTKGTPARLMLLVPEGATPGTNLAVTAAAYPRFFWFMPQTRVATSEFALDKAKKVEFTLHEGDAQTPDRALIYRTAFSVTGEAGIGSLALPQNAGIPPLEVGKTYHWRVTLICNERQPSQNLTADGWLQRVALDPTVTKQIEAATATNRADLYAKNGLWVETLSTLAAQRCAKPSASAATVQWNQLLKAVKLDQLVDKPLIQQCDPPTL